MCTYKMYSQRNHNAQDESQTVAQGLCTVKLFICTVYLLN